MSELKPLNPRQARFVEEYLLDLNGTQAAIRAGYSSTTAGAIAGNLLKVVEVTEAIERGKATRSARVNVSADTVITELSILATSCVEHYILDDEGQLRPAPDAPEGVMRAVKSIKRKSRVFRDNDGVVKYVEYDVSFELWDKPGQLKLLGRHAGAKAFFDRVEISGPGGKPIEITQIERTIVDVKA